MRIRWASFAGPRLPGATSFAGPRLPGAAVLACVLALSACADAKTAAPSPDGGMEEARPAFELKTPVLRRVAPSEISLGDKLQVFGEDLLDGDYGTTVLVLDGKYETEDGLVDDYQGELELTVLNPSLAEVEIDRLIFDQVGGDVGTFRGMARLKVRTNATATNAPVGTERSSQPGAVEITVGPSLEVVQLHAVETTGCPPVTRATNVTTPIMLELRALGFGEATYDDPITFRVGFDAPDMGVQYVKEDVYQSWPLDLHPGLRDTVFADAPQGQNMMTFTIERGDTIEIDPTTQQIHVQVNPPISVGAEMHSSVLLGRFATGPIEGGPGPVTANLILQAERGGRTARRLATVQIWNQWQILPYDGNQKVVERYPAEIPSGQCGSCIAGGDIGRDISYTEGESVSRTRSISMRWDVGSSNSVGAQIGTGPFIPIQIAVNAQTSWQSTFGMDVSATVTSEMHRSLSVNAHVLPSFYGVCYRQLTQYERQVDVVYHNACGAAATVGQAVLTDWGWGFDVATGAQCPPRTNLPPGEQFE